MIAAVAVAIAMLRVERAEAQDALRGKRLYLDAGRIVGSGVSCVDCHGGLPGAYGISAAANDPVMVAAAIDSVPDMIPLRGRIGPVECADLAAYIGQPGVPSPQVRVTTQRPSGAAGESDRIEFGEIAVGATSAPARLQIANTGQLAFTLTGPPAPAGTFAGEVSIVETDCEAGASLAPGQSCEIAVVFHPASIAEGATEELHAARLAVPHDWVYGAAAVALLGTVVLAMSPGGPMPGAMPPMPGPGDAPEDASPGGCNSRAGHAAWPVMGALVGMRWRARRRHREPRHPT
jgi:hypothetical protein